MLKILYRKLYLDTIPQGERHLAEHEAAHDLLSEGLKRLNFPSMEVQYTDNGKPYFDGNPVYFSFSHSGGVVVCALADTLIGVDVEVIRPKKIDSIKRIATRMFTMQEQKQLMEHNYDVNVFYEIWVRKEALVKRSGVGITGMAEADSFSNTIISHRNDGFVLAVAKDPAESLIIEVLSDVNSHKKSGF